MSLWSKVRSGVDLSSLRSEKDKSENDTVLSRAMLRFYGDQVPPWLAPAHAAVDPKTRQSSVEGHPLARSQTQAGSGYGQGYQPPVRTSLDFLQCSTPQANPIQNLTAGSTPTLSRGGRLGQKLRKSNW